MHTTQDPDVLQVSHDIDDAENDSTLAYARSQRLTQSHLDNRPKDNLRRLQRSTPGISSTGDLTSSDATIPLEYRYSERITSTNSAASLLRSALLIPNPLFETSQPSRVYGSMRTLQLELPLLLTDNEVDVHNFEMAAQLNLDSISKLAPLVTANEECDKNLPWIADFNSSIQDFLSHIKNENFELPSEGLRFLQSALTDSFEAMCERQSTEIEYRECLTMRLEPVTPPLLPISLPLFSEPSSDSTQLEILSEHESLNIRDIETIETNMLKLDAVHSFTDSDRESPMNTDKVIQIYSPIESVAESPSVTPMKRKYYDPKVEVPLFLDCTSIPVKRAKEISVLKDLEEALVPFPRMTKFDAETSDDSVDTFFEDVIEQMAMAADKNLLNEYLEAIDATTRVEVPTVSSVRLSHPWLLYTSKLDALQRSDEVELISQRKLLLHESRYIRSECQSLRSISKIEHQLRWMPIPQELTNVSKEEWTIDGSGLRILNLGFENRIRSEELVWKREGLRVLDDLDSDDELSMLYVEDDLCEEASLKAVFDTRKAEKTNESEIEHPPTVRIQTVKSHNTSHQPSETMDDVFSAFSSLSTFMEIQGAKPPIAFSESGGIQETASRQEQQQNTESAEMASSVEVPHQTLIHASTSGLKIVPELPSELPKTTVIFSSAILIQHRGLVKFIEQINPEIEIIERDFSNAPSLECDADISISPSTGIILTTVQKINQRPLPGRESSFYGIKDRLVSLSTKYSLLLVLAVDSSSLSDGVQNFDERDCLTLSEFQGFASTLESDHQLVYVSGGDYELATWIVLCTSLYHFDIHSLQQNHLISTSTLLADETTWERFLRKAGFNAFAAQVVLMKLGELAHTVSTEEGEIVDYSSRSDESLIRTFVTMSAEERIQHFEGLLGCQRVLVKVNEVLEQYWVSAANDFHALASSHSYNGLLH